ncbi:MAG: hypothetical protein EXX96DRAFT_379533 [Benjaminiella poitrasii]|nr:MAG: hypothetical protein EXX96DRAFT_379533 [Benjaminiella poitrasii]
MNSQHVNTRKIKTKRMPLEMHWVQTNIDRFDHLLFFNHFTSYCKDKAIRRFKFIVNGWIQDEAAKERLMFNFWSWRKSKESKIFWKEKEVAIALSNSNTAELCNEESSTLISASTVNNNHSADSTIMPTILEELECFFSENINHPGSESNFSIDGANISKAFYNF